MRYFCAVVLQFMRDLVPLPRPGIEVGSNDQHQRRHDRRRNHKHPPTPDRHLLVFKQQQAEWRPDEHPEGIAQPPVPPRKEEIRARHDAEGDQGRHADRSRNHAGRRPPEHREGDDLAIVLELAPGITQAAAHQRTAEQRLRTRTDGDQRCDSTGRQGPHSTVANLHHQVGQEGADPYRRQHARTEHQQGSQRPAGRREQGAGIALQNPQLQTGHARHEIAERGNGIRHPAGHAAP